MTGDGPGATEEPSICIGCGLCCDGTLLSHLAVSDQSDLGAPLVALGVEIIAAADPPVFELPCPAVAAGVCTIHHLHRPHACARYECRLLRSVHDGRVTRREARAVITHTVRLRDAVRVGDCDPAALDDQLDRHFRDS